MEWSDIKNNPEVRRWLTHERRTGIYIIEARDAAHYTTRTYKRDYALYGKHKSGHWKDGKEPPEPPVGRRIYKVGAAGNQGGTLGRRLSQYATLNFPNGFLVHYIGISGKSDPSFQPHGGHSNKSQVKRVEDKILGELKARGRIYRSLGASEWTFESLPRLIEIARSAHGANSGRQFQAEHGMLVDSRGTPITVVASKPVTIIDEDGDLPPAMRPFIERAKRNTRLPARFRDDPN